MIMTGSSIDRVTTDDGQREEEEEGVLIEKGRGS